MSHCRVGTVALARSAGRTQLASAAKRRQELVERRLEPGGRDAVVFELGRYVDYVEAQI